MTEKPDLLNQTWYAQEDDLIGGWCIANVNKRPSEHDTRKGEWMVADFISQEVAEHVAILHNIHLINERALERNGKHSRD